MGMGFDRGATAKIMIAVSYLVPGVLVGLAMRQYGTVAVHAVLVLTIMVLLTVAVLAQQRLSQDDYDRGMRNGGGGPATRV